MFAIEVSPLRRLLLRIRRLIESDSVRPFVILFYIPWLTWAIFATFLFPPVVIIQEQMGHAVYVIWVWLTIPGTLMPILGLAMRHGGSDIAQMKSKLLFRDWMGLWLQWGGHSCMALLLLLFEISAVRGAMAYDGPNSYAGMTIFAAFILSAYNLGLMLLATQIAMKLIRGEQLNQRSHM